MGCFRSKARSGDTYHPPAESIQERQDLGFTAERGVTSIISGSSETGPLDLVEKSWEWAPVLQLP